MTTKMGRPGLSTEAVEEIVKVMTALEPKTPEYRSARLNLALKYGRTEAAIEWWLKQQKTPTAIGAETIPVQHGAGFVGRQSTCPDQPQQEA